MPASRLTLPPEQLQSLLSTLLERTCEPAHPCSLPLWVAGECCGWVFPKACDALSVLSGIEILPDSVHIGRHYTPGPALDALLASVAQTLRSAGCAPGWRDELLDLWTNSSTTPTRIGCIERGVMRPLGLLTQAVHLNAWSASGNLWVARRALTKATDPGMWDTLVGGLIGSQEPPELALERETDEEAGLSASEIAERTPLRSITRMLRRIPEGYQVEEVLTCECILPAHAIPANRDGEVMEIQQLAPAKVLEMLQAGAFTIEASIVITEDLLRRSLSTPGI